MASDIQKLYDLPDISFIDGITAESVLNEMISDFQDKYYSITGEYEILNDFDKNRIQLNAAALKIYQAYQCIEKAGKMNLLKYSYGDYLLHLGANRSVEINIPKAAKCPVKFILSQVQSNVIPIPAGTLITAGDGVYFETENYCEIPIGTDHVITNAACQVTGTIGNNYEIGQINIITDPIPYVESVTNIAVPTGGEDIQTDDEFREKIYLSPSGYSTTGTEDSYIFWVKQFSSLISDVKVLNPSDGIAKVIVLKKDGIPDAAFLTDIMNYLINKKIKPMTDQVLVAAPTVVNYNIDGTYYINKSDVNNVESIQTKVTEAISEYTNWQKDKIGRDINPFHLQYLLAKAGIKRIDLNSPTFTNVDDTSIAIVVNINVVYGGIEDD